jgi:hypothetical protein
MQAKQLEKKITGYVSEFEKPKDIAEEKLFSYNNILDVNIKQNKHNVSQISMFDLFINLNISPEEVDKRFKNTKYDPNTKKTYNMELNPPADKKIIEKLLPGIPNYDSNKINDEKGIYEKNIYNLVNFYKIMTNGKYKIYKNIDQMDKSYINNINDNIENSIHEVIFGDYVKNIELITSNINKGVSSDKSDIKIEENKKTEEKGGKSESIVNSPKKEKGDKRKSISSPKKEKKRGSITSISSPKKEKKADKTENTQPPENEKKEEKGDKVENEQHPEKEEKEEKMEKVEIIP